MKRLTGLIFATLTLTACGQVAPVDPGTDAATAGDTATTVDVVQSPVDVIASDAPPSVDVMRVDIPPVPLPVDAGFRDAVTPRDAVDRDTPPLTFATIYETIIRPRCSSCHGGDATWPNPSMPDEPTAYANLVNVRVRTQWIESCASNTLHVPFESLYRVRPSDPEASMLYFLGRCYVRDAIHNTVTDPEREMIRAWIAAGAH